MANEDLKSNELEIFKKYRQTGDKRYFQQLYGSMKPIIYHAAKKAAYGSNLPESAHKIYAAQAFMDSLRTYDPNKGSALGTHVYNAVQHKVKRLNYMYQNLGSMPEPRAQKVGVFQNEIENLKAELNRMPTNEEIAKRMSIPVSEVVNMHREISRDLSLGEGTEEVGFAETSREEEALHHLYFDLTPEEKTVYDFVMGQHGKPQLVKSNKKIDFDAIGRNMGVSASKVRNVLSSIKKKLEKVAR